MSSPEDILPRGPLRVMQLIAGALPLGAVTYLAIALIVVANQGPAIAPAGNLPMLSLLAVIILAVEVPLAFIVPNFQIQSALRQIASGTWRAPPGTDPAAFGTDASKLLAVRQNTLLVGLAMLEGAAFLGCTAYLVEAQPFALAVAVAAIVLMLLCFPTTGRVRGWMQRQADRLTELRQQGM